MKRHLVNLMSAALAGLGGYFSTAFVSVMPEPCNVVKGFSSFFIRHSSCTAQLVSGVWRGETRSDKGRFPITILVEMASGTSVSGSHNAFGFPSTHVDSDGKFVYSFSDTVGGRRRYYQSEFRRLDESHAEIIYSVRDDSESGAGRFYSGRGKLSRE